MGSSAVVREVETSNGYPRLKPRVLQTRELRVQRHVVRASRNDLVRVWIELELSDQRLTFALEPPGGEEHMDLLRQTRNRGASIQWY